MAAKLLPYSILTLMTLSGFNYTTHYQHPKADNKPYILFIHGFPSSAYDWRHQVEYFSEEGYGIIAPDTLGYGGTSKPLDPHNYLLKGIGDSIVEVVNKVAGEECKVLGVGQDWSVDILNSITLTKKHFVLMFPKGVPLCSRAWPISIPNDFCLILSWMGVTPPLVHSTLISLMLRQRQRLDIRLSATGSFSMNLTQVQSLIHMYVQTPAWNLIRPSGRLTSR